jgi:hypothetical protein
MSQATITQAKKLAHLSSDCSFLLTHLIRKNDQQDEKQALSPQNKLVSILSINDNSQPNLNAHEVGWYGCLHIFPFLIHTMKYGLIKKS